MPIGELLIEQRKLSASDLERALDRQRREGKRLVSLLIASGALDFDTGSRALGAQRGVPALLEKHLASRDAKLARLIPAESGRAWGALPVGRASNGSLIVAARDPSALLKSQVVEVTRMTVTIVIAPATRLEELIAKEYGSAPVGELRAVARNCPLAAASFVTRSSSRLVSASRTLSGSSALMSGIGGAIDGGGLVIGLGAGGSSSSESTLTSNSSSGAGP